MSVHETPAENLETGLPETATWPVSDAEPMPEVALRRHWALVEIGQRAAMPDSSSTLLHDAAALLSEALGTDLCGAVQQHGEKLELWIAPTPLDDESQAAVIDRPELQQNSLFRLALESGNPIVSDDVGSDTRFDGGLLSRLGVASGLVSPILVDGVATSGLCVFSSTPRQFRPEDLLFVESIVQLLAVTLSREKVLAQLEQQSQIQTTLVDSIQAVVLELSPAGRIVSCNAACESISEFRREELQNTSFWRALAAAEEMTLVRKQFDTCQAQQGPVEFQAFLLTKTGERRQIAWNLAPLFAEDDAVSSVIATGIDITDQQQAIESAKEAAAIATKAQKTISELRAQVRREMGDQGQTAPFGRMEGKNSERRTRPRRAYPYLQAIAPAEADRKPPRKAFREVRCHDIAAGGFSFINDGSPLHDSYVVAFGAGKALTYIRAKVRHRSVVEIDGRRAQIVGCEYVERLEY